MRPGDVDLDGAMRITDAIVLLQGLFAGGGGRPPPCEGETIAAGANVTLLDFDGGGSVDLTDAIGILQYLFARGAPHALGVECVRIDGCPSACAEP